jgi:RNA polymerase sigma factor (sigma-70 family)
MLEQVLRSVAAGDSDRELLRRFVEYGDETAFAVLVSRHTPMVLGVCQRGLSNRQDAEDACQAVFVVLVRRARGQRWETSIANWLYATARKVAANARAAAHRRRKREGRAAVSEVAAPVDRLTGRELLAILDEELDRLPAIYREPLVLCCLEGLTRDEAAVRLGVPAGTLKIRLERGRKRLAKALALRGCALGAGLLALTATSPAEASSPRLLESVLAAASGASSPAVAALAEGVAVNGAVKKSLVIASTLVALTLLGMSFGLAPRTTASPVPEQPKTTPSGTVTRFIDPDSDGDGLPDFQEIHKYRTDPKKADTAGKGVSDGDWQQRREYSYSVRVVVRVMKPYNLAALNDDYQDVRVVKETKDFAELEVVVYPFNTNAEAIRGNPNWRKDYAGMKEYLAPGVTTNWDAAMRADLLRELAKDGIDPEKLTDKEAVEKVSRWLFTHSTFKNMFCTFYIGYRDGKPFVLPGLEQSFKKDQGDPKWTAEQQFEHELFGKQMFAHKIHGTCTSTAVYQTTVLRALGIPTRIILCIPAADGSDPAQVAMLEKGLTNHRVRSVACMGALAGEGFTSHTFCEVFVGGRWRRLNYTTLGQNVLEPNYLGLMIKVHTFNDLSEAKLGETWGTRYAKGQRDEMFPRNNPYRLLEIGDHFGQYAKLPNPPAEKEHKQVTISKAYCPDKSAPAEVQQMEQRRVRENLALLERGLGGLNQDRRFYVHCDEWFDNAGDYLQYKLFMRRADKNFVLKAKGQPDVSCQVSMGFYTHRTQNLCELEVVIPSSGYAKMVTGVSYSLEPANGNKDYRWKVRDGLTLIRE